MSDTQPTFDLGLVMAGAVSAGAYTAGVMDFLIQALDEWEKIKATDDPTCPRHNIRIKVMAGASAGGILSAMGGIVLDDEFAPVQTMTSGLQDPIGRQNKLFDTWVNQIDMVPLLGGRDLATDPIIRSLLDSSLLDQIADSVFTPSQRRSSRRNFVSDPLKIILTLTNLRGVPYRTEWRGGPPTATSVNLGMSLHADFREFDVSARSELDATRLRVEDLNHPFWNNLKQAALGTAAFPVGLKPRVIRRPASDYENRKWPVCQSKEVDGKIQCESEVLLRPMWELIPDDPYEFLCVDGGTMDNEPTQWARDVILPRNPSPEIHAEHAHAALILIDPFPDLPSYNPKDSFHSEYTLVKLFPKILGALINQARFKPDELLRARDPNVYDQYLISPHRMEGENRAPYDLACGALSGFSGFFSRKYREHDFQLGRKNCQDFLKSHFTLPVRGSDGERVPLFRGVSPDALKDQKILNGAGERLPIIPLYGSAMQPIQPPTYPSITEREFQVFRPLIRSRVQVVLQQAINNIEGWATRRLLSNALWFKRGDIAEYIMNSVGDELREWKLVK